MSTLKKDPKRVRYEALASLEPMFEEAIKQGLWFRLKYQGVTMSPLELIEAQKDGRYLCNSTNWVLVDPVDLLKSLEGDKRETDRRIADVQERMKTGGKIV